MRMDGGEEERMCGDGEEGWMGGDGEEGWGTVGSMRDYLKHC